LFKKILVPIGDSPNTESALTNACELAKYFDSEVRCLYVTNTEEIRTAYIVSSQSPELIVSAEPDFDRNVLEAVHKKLVREESIALEFFREWKEKYPHVDMRLEEVSGVIYEEILKREKDVDLIVMGRSISWEGEELGNLGENFRIIIHKSDIPVLACSHKYEIGLNIMACYDGGKPARKALDVAIKFAKKFKTPLHILSTWWNIEKAQSLNKEAVEIAEKEGIEVVPIVQKMNTVGTILGEIDHLFINLLFMGAYGDSPIKDLMLGSTTDQVVSRTGCPILLCR